MFQQKLFWFMLLGCCSLLNTAQADDWHGFVDFNLYPVMSKVENDTTFTVNAFIKFTDRLSYFSLNNFSQQHGSGKLPKFDTSYSEQNLRLKMSENSPFDLTFQANFRSGPNNDRHRLGIRWRPNDTHLIGEFLDKIHLNYALNWHAIQFDHESSHVWQLEHAFRLTLPYLSKRLYIAGFVDHTFNENPPKDFPTNPIVAEAQLGYEVVDNFFLVTEYRVNQYRRSDVNSIAMGLEYKIPF
jgi:hypothetical protein